MVTLSGAGHNELQLRVVMNKISDAVGPSLYKKRVALLGLAFKEGTNDVRHSLSMRLYRALRDQGGSVIGHDMLAASEAVEMEPELEVSDDLHSVLTTADVVVALNSDSVYSEIDWQKVRADGGTCFVIDTRGILDHDALASSGLLFDTLGSVRTDATA